MKDILRTKAKEYKEKFAIWRKRPTSTFEEVADIWAKKPILEHAYNDALYMLQRDKFMFNEVCNVLISGITIRKEHGDKNIVDIITAEDLKINQNAQKLRSRIMEYLGANSAPNVPSALILTSIIIDLERLGDYTKDLARLTLLKPIEMKGKYFTGVCNVKNKILKMFELTINAFENKNKEQATEAMNVNSDIRKDTDNILHQLDADKNLEGHYGVVYAFYLRFFRRVSAHLENIASSVIAPFPYLGFTKSIEFIKNAEDAKKKKEGKEEKKAEKQKAKGEEPKVELKELVNVGEKH